MPHTIVQSPDLNTPLLLILPHGLNVSGVTLWAVRLANTLAARGRACALLLHPEPPDQRRLTVEFHPRVEVIAPPGLPALDAYPGNFAPFIATYRETVRHLSGSSRRPVLVSPNLLGDCYGLAAALCLTEPEIVRVVGWQHSDIEYDARVLAHYEPILTAFVAVSRKIHTTLAARLPRRSADIHHIAYGVPISSETASQRVSETAKNLDPRFPPDSLSRSLAVSPRSPLKLLYTGRIEHNQKRILALPLLSAELDRRNIAHRLTIVGDGPASEELDAAVAGRTSITRLPAVDQPTLAALLDDHDAFVLPSRYEGLSVSMLEAMSHGCVPIVARTDSGATDAIDPGINGEIAEAKPTDDEATTARALADAVELYLTRRAPMAAAAARTAHDRYSLDAHANAVEKMLDIAAATPARVWPASRPCAFAAAPGSASSSGSGSSVSSGSGSVPADGPERLQSVLARLAGRRIIIHGTGRHTRELADILANSPAIIVALADDDRAHQGQTLWGWPIIAPADAARTGATDVVMSSWMHEEAIWNRREVYTNQRLTAHRLYAADEP